MVQTSFKYFLATSLFFLVSIGFSQNPLSASKYATQLTNYFEKEKSNKTTVDFDDLFL
jgi:hypothetical protein